MLKRHPNDDPIEEVFDEIAMKDAFEAGWDTALEAVRDLIDSLPQCGCSPPANHDGICDRLPWADALTKALRVR